MKAILNVLLKYAALIYAAQVLQAEAQKILDPITDPLRQRVLEKLRGVDLEPEPLAEDEPVPPNGHVLRNGPATNPAYDDSRPVGAGNWPYLIEVVPPDDPT